MPVAAAAAARPTSRVSEPGAAAAGPSRGTRSSFVAPFSREDVTARLPMRRLPPWSPPAAYTRPPLGLEPEHFAPLFRAVLAGPAVWSPEQRTEWQCTYLDECDAVQERYPQYLCDRVQVEVARRAYYAVALMRNECFPKRGDICKLASPAARGW